MALQFSRLNLNRTKNFKNKTALITGAAHGLGKALSLELAERGCHLFLTDIDLPGLREAASLARESGIEVHFAQADIGSWESVQDLAREFEKHFEKLDLLINNAAISVYASLKEMEMDDFIALSKVNYFGAVFCIKAFLPFLEKSESAQILNICSGAGLQGFGGRSAYCGSKFALRGISEAFHAEFYPLGIKVKTAFPGPVATDISKRSIYGDENKREKEDQYLKSKGLSPEKTANRILDALFKSKEEIMVTKDIKLLYFLKRYFPRIFPKYLSKNQDKLPV